MREFRRYAIYYAPRAGAFADATARWLGWDAVTGKAVPHPSLQGLPDRVEVLTAEPRKYGFHGTIKAPFRLAEGVRFAELKGAVYDLALSLRPVVMDGLALERLGRFLALVPEGNEADLLEFGAEVVSRLDPLRAALMPAELAKRDPERLTLRQRDLLEKWGYPYVMEEFRFHLTLTGALPEAVAQRVEPVLRDWLTPMLPRPFVIEDMCLFGEDGEGRFHLVSRHALAG